MKEGGSKTLAELAKRLGVEVENPVGFDPQTNRFFTLEDFAKERETFDEANLIWLLNFGQRGNAFLTPTDEPMFQSFVGQYSGTDVEADTNEMHKVANETIADVRRFVVERVPWELQLPRMKRIVEWSPPSGPYRVSAFRTAEWQTAFRLYASELVCEFGDRVRACKRQECERLFLAGDNRQIFCSRECSQKVQFEKYVKGIGGRKAWRKKHREQYHERKKEKENVKTRKE